MIRYATVVVDGHTISYASEGAGEPLLLLHGVSADHQIWSALFPYLAGHFRVIAPDLPGAGRSPSDTIDRTPDARVRQVAGLIAALKIGPCRVVGCGTGASIALGLAARHPDRVRALVVLCGTPLHPLPATRAVRFARAIGRAPGLLAVLLALVPRGLLRRTLAGGFADPARRAALRDLPTRHTLAAAVRDGHGWRGIVAQLGSVRAPTLLVWGERDAWCPLEYAEQLRRLLPVVQLKTISDAGHFLPLERPLELAEIIRAFLPTR